MKKYLDLMRINQPIGVWLLFLPCLMGLSLSYKLQGIHYKDFLYFASLFFVGSFLMRSAGCIINDMWDRNFDIKVKRTKERPIATGIISVKNAFILLFILLFFSLIILLRFNFQTIVLGICSIIFVISYPVMKRITYYPQIFLGITFNLGILFASTAILGRISIPHFLLYLSGIMWTTIYDTIYGYQDIDDDLKIGLKSTSIRFGEDPQRILFLLILLHLLFLIFVGISSGLDLLYFSCIFLASLFLFSRIKNCNFNKKEDCYLAFKANIWVGIIIFTAIILG